MSLVLFDHRCAECARIFEELVERSTPSVVTCPHCKYFGHAERLLSAPRLDTSLGVDASAFPTLGDKWVRNRKQHQRIQERRKLEHGD